MEATHESPRLKFEQEGDGRRFPTSGSRRTRSQAAPDWSVNDSLVLVNEIFAVEGDCLNAFSSFQKWEMISENCTAFGLNRTSNQCRRKWDGLLVEYSKIRDWESEEAAADSYWSLDGERRKELGLPENFDGKLFKAIDELVKAQEERSETEPDSDPEAECDVLDVTADSGSKKLRQHVKPRPPVSLKETELTVAEKLRNSAEQINAILKGSLSTETPCETFDPNAIRRQGDELIACFGDIVKNIGQLHDLVQGR